MRRSIQNHLNAVVHNEHLSDQERVYQDIGVIAMLDLCLWEGPKDEDIDQYFGTLQSYADKTSYLISFDCSNKPIAYSFWDKVTDRFVVNRQIAPFGDHMQHLKELRQLFGQSDAIMKFEDMSREAGNQKLW